MIIYIKNLKESIRKAIRTNEWLERGHGIQDQTTKKQPENEIWKIVAFMIVSKPWNIRDRFNKISGKSVY